LDNKYICEFLSSNLLILKILFIQALMLILFLAYKLMTTFLLICDIDYKNFLNHYRSEDDKPSETYFKIKKNALFSVGESLFRGRFMTILLLTIHGDRTCHQLRGPPVCCLGANVLMFEEGPPSISESSRSF